MPIRFTCPTCAADYTINDRAAGTEVRCGCGQPLVVPAAQPADPPLAAPVVVYVPPEVADYRPPRQALPPVERVHIREEVFFYHQERGTFLSSFGHTMGNGCGCILLAVIVGGVALAGMIFLAVLSHPPR